jgi:hypothetical protein
LSDVQQQLDHKSLAHHVMALVARLLMEKAVNKHVVISLFFSLLD